MIALANSKIIPKSFFLKAFEEKIVNTENLKTWDIPYWGQMNC